MHVATLPYADAQDSVVIASSRGTSRRVLFWQFSHTTAAPLLPPPLATAAAGGAALLLSLLRRCDPPRPSLPSLPLPLVWSLLPLLRFDDEERSDHCCHHIAKTAPFSAWLLHNM